MTVADRQLCIRRRIPGEIEVGVERVVNVAGLKADEPPVREIAPVELAFDGNPADIKAAAHADSSPRATVEVGIGAVDAEEANGRVAPESVARHAVEGITAKRSDHAVDLDAKCMAERRREGAGDAIEVFVIVV